MTDLAEILHNIADHTETLYRFLSEPGVADDIRGRLIDHIVLEEKENTVRLQDLHNTSPTALTQKMLDHSFVLQRVMGDLTMPLDLKQELLHHFIEEHQEWQKLVIGTASGHAEGTAFGTAPPPIPSSVQNQVAHQGGQRESHSGGHGGHGTHGGHGGHAHGGHGHGGGDAQGGHSHGERSEHSKPKEQSGTQPETREWTVGPLWNQGG